jgi:hypothetical protein
MLQMALLPFRRKACWGFFRPKKFRQLWPGANLRSWVPEASMLTTRPPKPLSMTGSWSCRSSAGIASLSSQGEQGHFFFAKQTNCHFLKIMTDSCNTLQQSYTEFYCSVFFLHWPILHGSHPVYQTSAEQYFDPWLLLAKLIPSDDCVAEIFCFNPFQSNFSATHILPISYLFWAWKRLVDYL